MSGQTERYEDFLTPGPEIERRVLALQARLLESDLHGMLLLHPVNLFYFSGTVQNGTLWVPANGTPVLFVARSLERAASEAHRAEIRPRDRLRDLEGLAPPGPACRVGIESDVLPEREVLRLRKFLPDRTLLDAAPLVQRVRQVKSAFELEWLRRAGCLHAETFREIPALIREGMTELELSARIEYDLRLRGHQGLVQVHRWNMNLFYGPVVSGTSACAASCFDGPVGARGLYPAVPQGAGRKRLRRGEPILIDLVFGCNGYFVDKSRTYVIGDPSGECLRLHELARGIQEAVVSRLRPGVNCASVYREIMEDFADQGLAASHFMGCGSNRVSFLGHGVGLELDEWPVLAPGFDEPLRAGVTLAVEPKFFPPHLGGVGLENTYHVAEAGTEKLTNFPDDLVSVPG